MPASPPLAEPKLPSSISDRRKTAFSRGILSAIGQTPLIRLSRYFDESGISVHAKLESFNPGGSAKDRPACLMIEDAIRNDRISKNTTVVESSSGNMGIGLAQTCAYYGLKFICVVDSNALSENLAIMRALGATIELVEHPQDGDFLRARLTRVKKILDSTSDSYWPNQYANPLNPEAHIRGTIREVDLALKGKLDILFVATSSTGTARGCRDYLRRKGRSTKVIAVDAEGSILFGGHPAPRKIPGLGAGVVSPLAENQKFSDVVRVSDVDCVVGCRRAAKREAVLLGGSGGGVLEAMRKYRSRLRNKVCAAIFHDSGTRYLNTVYDDNWVEENLSISVSELEHRIDASC